MSRWNKTLHRMYCKINAFHILRGLVMRESDFCEPGSWESKGVEVLVDALRKEGRKITFKFILRSLASNGI